ncbi:MAG: DEAD/DEAH box helicase, partial [Clostridia bacterium]|nr:DEAD/DEAH box helicase [Clostridia bacterium]
DTDAFPIEELEELMRSVREKRKYYRLEDGSFVSLESGQFSAFTQTADSLNLNVSSLSDSGTIVPLYKGLFLDELLKRDKSVSLEKDTDYKKLIRDFKSVEDGEFAVPEPLDKVLRDYQKTGYTWLRTLDKYGFGGILADDMGLGKTLQMLAFLLAIKREGSTGPALIACPASVVSTWGNEAQKWTPELRTCLITGGAADRANHIRVADQYDILVTSYDSLRNDIERHEKNMYRVCVLDEAQYIKNRETKLKKSVDRLKAGTRLALSGTPVENRLSELYSIFDFLMPGYLGSYTSFRRKYELPITEEADENARTTLTKLVHPFILRRMKRDVLSELPPKTETNCYIQMGEEQRKLYAAYANEIEKRMLSAVPSDKLKILAMLTRLREICCDPALVYEGYEEQSCKKDECVRMVKELIENEHRVLIFSQFTSMLSRIETALDAEGIDSFTLRGDTPLDERVRLVNAFNAGQNDVFLISLKAGGTGINLTGADTVIHYDPWWNLAAQNQATDRCYRIGQERPVQVYKLIASDTIEENIVKLQYKKLDLAKVVSENADGGLMNMSAEELLELLK